MFDDGEYRLQISINRVSSAISLKLVPRNEREQLGALVRKGKGPARRLLKARILLKRDQRRYRHLVSPLKRARNNFSRSKGRFKL